VVSGIVWDYFPPLQQHMKRRSANSSDRRQYYQVLTSQASLNHICICGLTLFILKIK